MGQGYLGIDLGTQGLSVIFTDADMRVVATGEAGYDMVAGLPPGCYEQTPQDWEDALIRAMKSLATNMRQIGEPLDVASIGISGQMHGEVQIFDRDGSARNTRLWCDARNEVEEQELTALLNVKMPKRMTAVRWLWSLRNRGPETANVCQLTTPGGWLARRLTGQHVLGIGDASGMFPINQNTLEYDAALVSHYDALVQKEGLKAPSLLKLLPQVRRAGQEGGVLNEHGSAVLGLPIGTPVAPAEGDQPAALAGSLIGLAGMVSMSFGTSVCANSVGDRTFAGVSRAIDHFCAVDGKPINMVWLRNGTTYMNTVVQMVGGLSELGLRTGNPFAAVIPELLAAAPDCGGVLALPFMDDEPGVGVSRGGTAMLIGLNADNATPGNVARAALLATVFNLRLGCELLLSQGFPLNQIVLSGGLTKSPQLGQVLSDGFNLPVTILASGSEGSAWGAALMAKYRHQCLTTASGSWSDFLSNHASGTPVRFTPSAEAAAASSAMFAKYKRLLQVHKALDDAISS